MNKKERIEQLQQAIGNLKREHFPTLNDETLELLEDLEFELDYELKEIA